jgi:two-component system, NarL family, nitrate/nitrite response regulator NarL
VGQRTRRTSSSDQPLSSEEASPQAGGSTPESRPGETRGWLHLVIAGRPGLLRDALTRLLETVPDLRIVGYGETEEQIRKLSRSLLPGLVLFDYEAMGPHSESMISNLRRAAPRTRILVIARRTADETIESVLRAGASGLVGDDAEFATLVRAIQFVGEGELWANRRIAARVLEGLTAVSAPVTSLKGLTKREVEIADGVALGLSNKDIALQLNISEATVKSHLNAIFRRLKIEGRVALAMLTRERSSRASERG